MQGNLRKLVGFGPLSRVINNHVETLETRAVTKEEGNDVFLNPTFQSFPGSNSIQLEGDLTLSLTDPGTTGRLWVDGILTGTEIIATSDERVKDDIVPLKGCLHKILGLEAFSYSRNDWEETGVPENERYIGLLAQRVQEILPELVRKDFRTADRQLSVNYPSLIAILIESIKELYENLRYSRLDAY